jgi:hypothetical protein
MMKCRGMGKIRPIAFSKGGSTKDACYRKVKGAKNWGNKSSGRS